MFHLPAIVIRTGDETFWTMVTACGARGPMRRREDGVRAGEQLTLVEPAGPAFCELCAVRWDEAEETGSLRLAWVTTQRSVWQGPGATLHLEQPMPWRCRKCGRADTSLFAPEAVAVVVREDRTRVVRS